MLVVLAALERHQGENQRRISELEDAATLFAHVERYPRVQDDTVEARFRINKRVLVYGKMPLVVATVMKMLREWRVWFKNVGDLERIREDHGYALSLDNERYVYLTQEFDPKDAFDKTPGAPWPWPNTNL